MSIDQQGYLQRRRIRRRSMLFTPGTLVTLQDLADFVHMCAEADMGGSTRVNLTVKGWSGSLPILELTTSVDT